MIVFAHHPSANTFIEHNWLSIPIVVCSVGLIFFCIANFLMYKHFMDIHR